MSLLLLQPLVNSVSSAASWLYRAPGSVCLWNTVLPELRTSMRQSGGTSCSIVGCWWVQGNRTEYSKPCNTNKLSSLSMTETKTQKTTLTRARKSDRARGLDKSNVWLAFGRWQEYPKIRCKDTKEDVDKKSRSKYQIDVYSHNLWKISTNRECSRLVIAPYCLWYSYVFHVIFVCCCFELYATCKDRCFQLSLVCS